MLRSPSMGTSAESNHPQPIRANQIREGERYELSEGRKIYCQPTGGRGAGGTVSGGAALATDPAVNEAGFDPGYSPDANTLRAPDIAVGNVPNAPGWILGAPPLAVEYADTGQDEQALTDKIKELLEAGTRYLWVVRLDGPRRVEVHEPDRKIRIFGEGDELEAPGVLQNPVPVRALYDREAAHEVTLRNLLQRKGYASLEALQAASKTEGAREGLVAGIEALCNSLSIEFGAARREQLEALGVDELRELLNAVSNERTWPSSG